MRRRKILIPACLLALVVAVGFWTTWQSTTRRAAVTWHAAIQQGAITTEVVKGKVHPRQSTTGWAALKKQLHQAIQADTEKFRGWCGSGHPNRTEQQDVVPVPSRLSQDVLAPVSGLYSLNPALRKDPFYKAYPDIQSKAVRNAVFFAKLFQSIFTVRGFELLCDGHRVGLLPAIYMGFPKTGSTSAHSFLERTNPCMVRFRPHALLVWNDVTPPQVAGLDKETNHWIYGIRPLCRVENLTLTWCDPAKIINRTIGWAGMQLKGAEAKQRAGKCRHPFVVDGSMALMWDFWMHLDLDVDWGSQLPGVGRLRRGVPFDVAVFIRAVTPAARFLVLVRERGVALLRSHYWYFMPQSSLDNYTRDLTAVHSHLRGLLGAPSPCAAMLRSRTFTPYPRVNSMASSCNVLPYVALFGHDAVFATDVSALLACQDSLFAWIAAANSSLSTSPVRSLPTAGDEAGPPPACSPKRVVANARKKDKKVYGEEALEAERLVLAALEAAAPPLLPCPSCSTAPSGAAAAAA